MTNIILIVVLTSLAIVSAAQNKKAVSQKADFSTSYKPSAFPDERNRLKDLEVLYPEVEKMLGEYARQNHLPSVAYGIVVDGKLVFSGATGLINLETKKQATVESPYRIASMTKSFTAMAVMKLQEEGKLSLWDPASKYVPEMREWVYLTRDAPPVTIHHLLTMTAGFPEDNPWGDRQLEDTDEEFRKFLKGGVSFSSVPGQRFEYSNMGYAILGSIVSRVSGMPYQAYISKNILQPLGMNHTYWEFSKINPNEIALGYRWEDGQWKKEPLLHDGAYGAMGGLITTIEDFSKYVAFHLSAYPHGNETENGPVKKSSVREMHKPYTTDLFTDSNKADGTPCPIVMGYGFGLGYREDCDGIIRISHGGGLPGFGSDYRFYPDYGIGIMSFSNRTYAGLGGVDGRVFDMLVRKGGLKPRVLPVSDILNKRKTELVAVLDSWDEKKSDALFAENFFLDLSRPNRIKMSTEVLDKAGRILSIGSISPENQLRGSFIMKGEKGDVYVYFTLTPESDPKIQQLDLEFKP